MLFYLAREILRGKSLLRALMNRELVRFTLAGKVLDVGGGRDPSYYKFLRVAADAEIANVDLVAPEGSGRAIDVETAALPRADGSVDQALLFNILEHVYDYRFLLGEVRRVLKENGGVLGFVPFLINVHPDPHDYFRYTKEALVKMFSDAGFRGIEIKEIGRGPFAVNYNNLVASLPRLIGALMLPFSYALDGVFLALRPKMKERYPLGYLFSFRK